MCLRAVPSVRRLLASVAVTSPPTTTSAPSPSVLLSSFLFLSTARRHASASTTGIQEPLRNSGNSGGGGGGVLGGRTSPSASGSLQNSVISRDASDWAAEKKERGPPTRAAAAAAVPFVSTTTAASFQQHLQHQHQQHTTTAPAANTMIITPATVAAVPPLPEGYYLSPYGRRIAKRFEDDLIRIAAAHNTTPTTSSSSATAPASNAVIQSPLWVTAALMESLGLQTQQQSQQQQQRQQHHPPSDGDGGVEGAGGVGAATTTTASTATATPLFVPFAMLCPASRAALASHILLAPTGPGADSSVASWRGAGSGAGAGAGGWHAPASSHRHYRDKDSRPCTSTAPALWAALQLRAVNGNPIAWHAPPEVAETLAQHAFALMLAAATTTTTTSTAATAPAPSEGAPLDEEQRRIHVITEDCDAQTASLSPPGAPVTVVAVGPTWPLQHVSYWATAEELAEYFGTEPVPSATGVWVAAEAYHYNYHKQTTNKATASHHTYLNHSNTDCTHDHHTNTSTHGGSGGDATTSPLTANAAPELVQLFCSLETRHPRRFTAATCRHFYPTVIGMGATGAAPTAASTNASTTAARPSYHSTTPTLSSFLPRFVAAALRREFTRRVTPTTRTEAAWGDHQEGSDPMIDKEKTTTTGATAGAVPSAGASCDAADTAAAAAAAAPPPVGCLSSVEGPSFEPFVPVWGTKRAFSSLHLRIRRGCNTSDGSSSTTAATATTTASQAPSTAPGALAPEPVQAIDACGSAYDLFIAADVDAPLDTVLARVAVAVSVQQRQQQHKHL